MMKINARGCNIQKKNNVDILLKMQIFIIGRFEGASSLLEFCKSSSEIIIIIMSNNSNQNIN